MIYTVIVKKDNKFEKGYSFNKFETASKFAKKQVKKGYKDVTLYPTKMK